MCNLPHTVVNTMKLLLLYIIKLLSLMALDSLFNLDTKGRRRRLCHALHYQLLLNSGTLYSQQSQQYTEGKTEK